MTNYVKQSIKKINDTLETIESLVEYPNYRSGTYVKVLAKLLEIEEIFNDNAYERRVL